MSRLRLSTAGESHGPALLGILEGLPAGLPVEASAIDRDLQRRQQGFGRGGRMRIERDQARILGGVRFGRTLGSPVALMIENRDFDAWRQRMAIEGSPSGPRVTIPRPGHADLAGAIKYGHDDLREVLERASARETAMRVALGGLARALLRELGIHVGSWVLAIGSAEARAADAIDPVLARSDAEALALRADASPVRCLDPEAEARMVACIEEAQRRRDTVGGRIEVRATGVPAGLGSYAVARERLDARLCGAMAGIPAIKAAEIGDGWASSARWGSEVHDPIVRAEPILGRGSNRAGGLEGGVTNGEPLVVRMAMKPLSTVPTALPSVDLATGEPAPAHVERSDTCAVPAAGVVAEAALALELAGALMDKLGGDSLDELRPRMAQVRARSRRRIGHVFLAGMMGAGKTTVGRLLAQALGRPFVDLDDQIAHRGGQSARALFEDHGEERFRELESETLLEQLRRAPAVIALGGGAVLRACNRAAMHQTGAIVWLDAPASVLASRVGPGRPLLAGCASPDERALRLEALQQARLPEYRRSDWKVSAEPPAAEVAEAIRIGLSAHLGFSWSS